MQIDLLVLDGAPQSFGENIVHGAPASIHADFDFLALQAFQIFWAGEVAALVTVPDFGFGGAIAPALSTAVSTKSISRVWLSAQLTT